MESIINGQNSFVNPKVYCIEPEIWEIDGINNQRGDYFCKSKGLLHRTRNMGNRWNR